MFRLQPGGGAEAMVEHAPTLSVHAVLRAFWPHTALCRRWLPLQVVLIVLGPVTVSAQIWLWKLTVDQVLVPRTFGPLVWIAAASLSLALLGGVIAFASDYLSTWLGERFVRSLRSGVFAHLQTLSLDVSERRPLGDLLSRLTSDTGAIESFVVSGVASSLSYVIRIGIAVGLLFYLRWELALAALMVAPLSLATSRRYSRLRKAASREKRRRTGTLNAVAGESLAHLHLVQAYGREATELQRFERESEGSFRAELASARIKGLYAPVIGLIESTGGLSVIVLGTWELTRGRLTLGGLLVFLAYLSSLYGPVRGLGRLTGTVWAAVAAAERLVEVLSLRPTVREAARPQRLERAAGTIEFRSVSFRYPGADVDAVSNLSFKVGPGETLALVGRSGAGKSTVVRLLLRFCDPTSGEILIDGHDLRELDLAWVRSQFGVLLQESLVFDGTIHENIAYGKDGATDEEVVAAAGAAGAHEFIDGLPDGYATRTGQRGRLLSGGQRQRIALARAIVRDAPVLVLDEPTTGLDERSARQVISSIRTLARGRASIVISHDPMVVGHATATVELRPGRAVRHRNAATPRRRAPAVR